MVFNRILRYFKEKRKNTRKEFLFTLGYEGLIPEEFLNRLRKNNINILVDVREVPRSRKKGFSNAQLENMLCLHGIKYVHIQKLGSPSSIRKKIKENANYDYFFDKYRKYLKTQIEELKTLQKMIESSTCCLMCFEKDFKICHRKIIAGEMERFNGNRLKVVHL